MSTRLALRLLVLTCGCLPAGSSPLAAANNFVFNGDFATNVAGWSSEEPGEADLAWSSLDAAGSPASGSVRVRNFHPGGQQGIGISQCAGGVVPGDPYSWGGKIRLPTGQNRTGDASIGLRFKSGPNCTGSNVNQPRLSVETPGNSFVARSAAGTVPAGAASVEFVAFPSKDQAGSELIAFFDDLFFETAACAAGPTTLCLNGARFRVQATWTTAQGSGAGQAIQLTNDTGYFWFFKASNVEAVVKVHNACAVPGDPRFWFFAGGLTNVRVLLVVTDTKTGETRTYLNPQNTPFQPIQDTNAFATCP